MQVLDPLLWKDVILAANTNIQTQQIDFDLPYNEGVMLIKIENENPLSPATTQHFHWALSLDPNFAPADANGMIADSEVIISGGNYNILTTSGASFDMVHEEYVFPEGLIIARDLGWAQIGTVNNMRNHMRLYYRRVRLTDAEIAGLVVHRRRI